MIFSEQKENDKKKKDQNSIGFGGFTIGGTNIIGIIATLFLLYRNKEQLEKIPYEIEKTFETIEARKKRLKEELKQKQKEEWQLFYKNWMEFFTSIFTFFLSNPKFVTPFLLLLVYSLGPTNVWDFFFSKDKWKNFSGSGSFPGASENTFSKFADTTSTFTKTVSNFASTGWANFEKLTDKFLTRQHKQIDSLEKNLNEMRSTYVEGSNNLAKCQTNLHHEVVHKNECEAKVDNYYNTAVGYYNYAKEIQDKIINHNAVNKEKKISFQEIPELPYDKKK